MPGWLLYGVLYLLFAGVTLWLVVEALMQHGAPVLFRLLALTGFAALWAGIAFRVNALIFGGLGLFAVAQLVVTTYVRRGVHRGWALGGGKSRRGRRGGGASRPARSAGQSADLGADLPADTTSTSVFAGEPALFDPMLAGFDPAPGQPDSARHQDPYGAAAETVVGMGFAPVVEPGFGPGFEPAGPSGPAPAAPVEQTAAPDLAGPPFQPEIDPIDTPVISPFVDDAYAQELAAEYAGAEDRGFAEAAEATQQFAQPFADPGVDQGAPDPRNTGAGGVGGGVGPAADRAPSVWDTYERRVRLPDAGKPAPAQPSFARQDFAAREPAERDPAQFDSGQLGQAQAGPSQPGAGGAAFGAGPFGPGPAVPAEQAFPASPAPWPRLPDQPGPAFAVPPQASPPRQEQPPAAPRPGEGSWRNPPSSETLIGHIVSDEDLSFADNWPQESDPAFGVRSHPQPPSSPLADATGIIDPAMMADGWQRLDNQVPPPAPGQPAQPGGGGRHGRGKRRKP